VIRHIAVFDLANDVTDEPGPGRRPQPAFAVQIDSPA